MIPLWALEWQQDSVRGGKILGRIIFKNLENISLCSLNVASITIKMADTKSVFAGQLFVGLERTGQYFCQSACISVILFTSRFSQSIYLSVNQSPGTVFPQCGH